MYGCASYPYREILYGALFSNISEPYIFYQSLSILIKKHIQHNNSSFLVKVKPLLSNLKSKDLIEQILKIYNGQTKLTPSVKSLAKRGWSEKAVQIINCLLWEMEYIKPEDLKTAFSHQFKFKLLRDLLMVKHMYVYEMGQILAQHRLSSK